jgi:two-component system OmpR family response regulator
MKLKLWKKSRVPTAHLETIVNTIKSCSVSCGIILVECTLPNEQLKGFKKRIAKEANQKTHYIYDEQSSWLAIIFEGLQQSHTHWLGLFVKSYMQSAYGLEGGLLIASFQEEDYPNMLEVEEIIQQLTAEAEAGGNLIVYKKGSKNDNKESVVLIIDDDVDAGDFLKMQLKTQGYEVHQAYDGVQGIRFCEELHPDVVIMELNLPALDGYQVIRNIRESEAIESKIIVLSEQRLDKDINACFDLGVADYLIKPYSPLELGATLQRVIDETAIDME